MTHHAAPVDLRELLQIDIESELRKLTVAQLQGPWQLPAELLRRAIRVGAKEVTIEVQRGGFVVRDNGPAVPKPQLDALATLLSPEKPATARHHALLLLEAAGGVALLALTGIGATQIEIETGSDGKGYHLRWSTRGSATIRETSREGTVIRVRGAAIDPGQIRSWLRDAGRFAPGVVTMDGQQINHGLKRYLAHEAFELGTPSTRLHGHLAISTRGEQARVWLLHDGVLTTHLGLSSVPCFDAIVEAGQLCHLQATPADLRAALNPHLVALADLGVGLLLKLAQRLPTLAHQATHDRIVGLLLDALRHRRRLPELMRVPLLPCWTPLAGEHPAGPAQWLPIAGVLEHAKNSAGPPMVLALYPEQDPATFTLPEAPVLRLDASERSALSELFGFQFRTPPLRDQVGRQQLWRQGVLRRLGRLGGTLAAAVGLGPGTPLPLAALRPEERQFLADLQAVLPEQADAPRDVVIVPGRTRPRVQANGSRLVLGRDHPDVRACIAAHHHNNTWIYPAALTLLRGHTVPTTAARTTWLRNWFKE